jgi:hypothetical protein
MKKEKRAHSSLSPQGFHPSSFIPHPLILRDGATGSTSGFGPEDEGSTPSPAAKNINSQIGTSILKGRNGGNKK